jgi:molybdopterin converting factor small subunit
MDTPRPILHVLLFGLIAEKAGSASLAIPARNMAELRHELAQHIPGLQQLSHAIAVDRRVVHHELELTGREEIAVLPPFAGG